MNKRTFAAPTLRPVLVAVAVLLLFPTCSWPAPASPQDAPPQWLLSLFSWLAAVNTHRPGQADAAVGAGANQRLIDLEDVLGDLMALGDRLSKAPGGAVKYQDHEFSVAELRTIMGFREAEPVGQGLTRLLHRAAVYHADVALITSRDDQSARGLRRPGRTSYLVGDGQQTRQTTSTVHWAFGRALLDHLEPGPARDPLARAWYLATASVLQSLRLVSEADDHLSRARRIFPDDARLLFEGACAVETLTAPTLQAAAGPIPPGPRPGGTFRTISSAPSVRSLLRRAEQLFRRALQRNPTLTEARVRLARLTAGDGQHAEAIDLLQQALAAPAREEVRYLALMQLGDEELAVGRRAEARGRYEAAARLFPTAQTPLLALGLAARESGDRPGAAAALDRLSRLPVDPLERIDPAWFYYMMQGWDADRLMQELYALAEKEAR